MRDYMARVLYWILALLNWLRDNRPEWCWGQPIGYKETFDDPVVYKVLFSGFRLRGLSKRTFGVTKQVAMTDKEKDDYFFTTTGDAVYLGVEPELEDFKENHDDPSDTGTFGLTKEQIAENAATQKPSAEFDETQIIEMSEVETDEYDIPDTIEDDKKSD